MNLCVSRVNDVCLGAHVYRTLRVFLICTCQSRSFGCHSHRWYPSILKCLRAFSQNDNFSKKKKKMILQITSKLFQTFSERLSPCSSMYLDILNVRNLYCCELVFFTIIVYSKVNIGVIGRGLRALYPIKELS